MGIDHSKYADYRVVMLGKVRQLAKDSTVGARMAYCKPRVNADTEASLRGSLAIYGIENAFAEIVKAPLWGPAIFRPSREAADVRQQISRQKPLIYFDRPVNARETRCLDDPKVQMV
jgi:hypothetical protein